MWFFQVRLICNDGTRYTKDIDIVRKCACTKKCYWLSHAADHNSNAHFLDAKDEEERAKLEADQPQQAAMTGSSHILNLQPQNPPKPDNKPYRLTFFVENQTEEGARQMELQMTDFSDSKTFYDEVLLKSYDNSLRETKHQHDNSCLLSAFFYFVTITMVAYLIILWVRQRLHIQMELLHWWWIVFL